VAGLFVAATRTPQEPPTFRGGVQAVEVDVRITDSHGTVVRGLRKEDFELREDDGPQQILGFSFIDIPLTGQSSGSGPSTGESAGRMYVMLLNRLLPTAERIAKQFVDVAVKPGDYMAVTEVLNDTPPPLTFLGSRSSMLSTIDQIFARKSKASSGDPSLLPAGGRYGRDPLVASNKVAAEVFKQLGRITGRRKAVIWIGPPAVFMSTDPERMTSQRDALRAATRNNVAVYSVSPFGLTTGLGAGSLAVKAGYMVLAEDTGGDVIVDSNNYKGAFERFLRDSSSYYLLSYEPTKIYRDGKFHPITVRVKRPDVTIRSRRGYYANDSESARNAASLSFPILPACTDRKEKGGDSTPPC
jgi:VWFA-related protein